MNGTWDFVTEDGSIYRVDFDGRVARRIIGVEDPPPHFHEREKFAEAYCAGPGHPLVVAWRRPQTGDTFGLETSTTAAVREMSRVADA